MKDSPESGVQAGVERQSPREEVEMTAETAGVVKNPTEWAALARETAREVVKPERKARPASWRGGRGWWAGVEAGGVAVGTGVAARRVGSEVGGDLAV